MAAQIHKSPIHIVFWTKSNVLYFRTSRGNTGSTPFANKELAKNNLLNSLGYSNYTTEDLDDR
jgi:hypothetical protein